MKINLLINSQSEHQHLSLWSGLLVQLTRQQDTLFVLNLNKEFSKRHQHQKHGREVMFSERVYSVVTLPQGYSHENPQCLLHANNVKFPQINLFFFFCISTSGATKENKLCANSFLMAAALMIP